MSSNKPVSTSKTDKQLTVLSGMFRQLQLVWKLFTDRRVSVWAKSVVPISFLYLISPIDFIPDVFLGLGQLDDLGVILLGMALFVRLCPPELVNFYLNQIEYGDIASSEDESIDTTYRVIDEE